MALNLTSEEQRTGKENFNRTVGELGLNRRDFMKGLLAAGAVLPVTAAAYYGYKYEAVESKPVRAAIIGTGDEGGVLIGEHNPKYLQFVAACDIRPSNRDRMFKGDPDGKGGFKGNRKGFENIEPYGKDARSKIKVFDKYQDMLNDDSLGIEAVVIAVPLFLHAPIAIDCLKAGKHVLTEKLMAWNISQCKEMIKVAEEHNRIICVGHQRHYSLLYAHAVEVINAGILGEIRHIRAQWHRNNSLPKLDAKGNEIPGVLRDSWRPDIPAEDRKELEASIRKHGYKSMEELCRWRLYNRTGAGLMAELGSHQLDACSIFLGKVHPLAVTGVGGKYFYRDDREVDDHVFTTFEFPGKDYYKAKDTHEVKDKDDKVIVTYSSISTNALEAWGECVMGNRGTMVVEREQNIYLFPEAGGKSAAVGVTGAGGGKPVLDASASTGPSAAAAGDAGSRAIGATVSRGYREEMEHFAYCIRMWDQMSKEDRPKPRCEGKVAMADAIIALTSNLAMKHQKRIEFKPEWFDPNSPEVPDAENKAEIITG